MGATILDNLKVLQISDKMSREDLLSMMADTAIETGWAKTGFKEALLLRESKYATGLHASMDIAIPHADAEWTNNSAMIVAILDEPAEFEPMGGEGDQVQACFVFLLVIPDASAHIEFLSSMAEFIEDPDRLKKMHDSKDISELIVFLREHMNE